MNLTEAKQHLMEIHYNVVKQINGCSCDANTHLAQGLKRAGDQCCEYITAINAIPDFINEHKE